jgi:hypothetical protein
LADQISAIFSIQVLPSPSSNAEPRCPQGAEGDPLRWHRGIGDLAVVGRDQLRDVEQPRRWSRTAREGIDCHDRLRAKLSALVGAISPNLPLRLPPVLIRLTVPAASLLVQFIGPTRDLRSKIERVLGQR